MRLDSHPRDPRLQAAQPCLLKEFKCATVALARFSEHPSAFWHCWRATLKTESFACSTSILPLVHLEDSVVSDPASKVGLRCTYSTGPNTHSLDRSENTRLPTTLPCTELSSEPTESHLLRDSVFPRERRKECLLEEPRQRSTRCGYRPYRV